MEIDWSSPLALDDVLGNVSEASGVYRIWDTGPELVYVGQSANLKSRLSHSNQVVRPAPIVGRLHRPYLIALR
jgi:excinuclease UvrABC nuclease subunit